jgi:hypothetical protein
MVLIMVDTAENVARAQAILEKMLTHGAVVTTDVEATYYGTSAQGKEPFPGRP